MCQIYLKTILLSIHPRQWSRNKVREKESRDAHARNPDSPGEEHTGRTKGAGERAGILIRKSR
jgi:hypothetical protein